MPLSYARRTEEIRVSWCTNGLITWIWLLDVLMMLVGLCLQVFAGWLYIRDPMMDMTAFLDHERRFHAKVIILFAGAMFLFTGYAGAQFLSSHNRMYTACYGIAQLVLLMLQVWIMFWILTLVGDNDRPLPGGSWAAAKSFDTFSMRFHTEGRCNALPVTDSTHVPSSTVPAIRMMQALGDADATTETPSYTSEAPANATGSGTPGGAASSTRSPTNASDAPAAATTTTLPRTIARQCESVTAIQCHHQRELRRQDYMNDYCRSASDMLKQGYNSDCDDCVSTFYAQWIRGGEYEYSHPEKDLRGKWHNTDAGLVFCRCYARFVGLARTILRILSVVIVIQVIHIISIIYLANCVTFPEQENSDDDDDRPSRPSSRSRTSRNRRSNVELENRRRRQQSSDSD